MRNSTFPFIRIHQHTYENYLSPKWELLHVEEREYNFSEVPVLLKRLTGWNLFSLVYLIVFVERKKYWCDWLSFEITYYNYNVGVIVSMYNVLLYFDHPSKDKTIFLGMEGVCKYATVWGYYFWAVLSITISFLGYSGQLIITHAWQQFPNNWLSCLIGLCD